MTVHHLLGFATEAEALANSTLSRWIVQGESGPDWDRSQVFPDIAPVLARASYDAEGNEVTSYARLPGFYVLISIDGNEPDADLTALGAHRLAASPEMAAMGYPYVFAAGLNVTQATMQAVIALDGVPAGSRYPFGHIEIQ